MMPPQETQNPHRDQRTHAVLGATSPIASTAVFLVVLALLVVETLSILKQNPAPGDWLLLPGAPQVGRNASGILWERCLAALDRSGWERDSVLLLTRAVSVLVALTIASTARRQLQPLALLGLTVALSFPTRIAGDPTALTEAGRNLSALALLAPLVSPASTLLPVSIGASALATSLDTNAFNLGQAAVLVGLLATRSATARVMLATFVASMGSGYLATTWLGSSPDAVRWWSDLDAQGLLTHAHAYELCLLVTGIACITASTRLGELTGTAGLAAVLLCCAWTTARTEARRSQLDADSKGLATTLDQIDVRQGRLVFVNVPLHLRPALALRLGESRQQHVHLETWDDGTRMYIPAAWNDLPPESICLRWKGRGFRTSSWSECLRLEAFPAVVRIDSERVAQLEWMMGSPGQGEWNEPDDVVVDDRGREVECKVATAGNARLAVAVYAGRRSKCSETAFLNRGLRKAWFDPPFPTIRVREGSARVIDQLRGFGPVLEVDGPTKLTLELSGR